MDESTQQNAALVEEMAAAASTLKFQATELVQTVSVFKVGASLIDVGIGAGLQNSKCINVGSKRSLVLLS